jgi:hypothetical protein
VGQRVSGAAVRQLLDMRVGLAFDEDYLATSGPIVQYRKAINWNPLEPGETATDLRAFLPTLTATSGPHGGAFNYVSPCTDLLGWIIERASGRRYADLFSDLHRAARVLPIRRPEVRHSIAIAGATGLLRRLRAAQTLSSISETPSHADLSKDDPVLVG